MNNLYQNHRWQFLRRVVVIPVFGLLWGNLFLGETFVMNTLIAGVIILFGTGLTIGLIKFQSK